MQREPDGGLVSRPVGDAPPPALAAEISHYYALGVEQARLLQLHGRLERARTELLLRRHLPRPPAVVLDVGGGPGVYALDLARQGYRVHLIEPVPLHLEQAAAAQSEQPDHPLESLAQGDARALRFADGIADAVLMLGPLYHLSERAERLRALREARRVLRAGGVLCVAAISRFASLLDGLRRQMLVDPQFASIVRQDLLDGRHVNLSGRVEHFTTAYFHRPEELRAELAEVGLPPARIVAVEGPAWLLGNLEAHWRDPQHRLALLQALEAVEEEPALLGASAHILAVARREA